MFAVTECGSTLEHAAHPLVVEELSFSRYHEDGLQIAGAGAVLAKQCSLSEGPAA